jgi:hypothetical protein
MHEKECNKILLNKSLKLSTQMPQAMQDPICFETLLATVLLWISLFGMSECALRNVDAKYHIHFYAFLFSVVLVYLYFARMSFCSLM